MAVLNFSLFLQDVKKTAIASFFTRIKIASRCLMGEGELVLLAEAV